MSLSVEFTHAGRRYQLSREDDYPYFRLDVFDGGARGAWDRLATLDPSEYDERCRVWTNRRDDTLPPDLLAAAWERVSEITATWGPRDLWSSSDWREVFKYASPSAIVGFTGDVSTFGIADVAEVIAESAGENDGPEWLIVVRLRDGRFGFVHAGCDYTGWDCQAGGDALVAASLVELVQWGLGQSERDRLGLDVARDVALRDLRARIPAADADPGHQAALLCAHARLEGLTDPRAWAEVGAAALLAAAMDEDGGEAWCAIECAVAGAAS